MLLEDLLDRDAASQQVEDQGNPDPMTPDAGFPKQTVGSIEILARSSSLVMIRSSPLQSDAQVNTDEGGVFGGTLEWKRRSVRRGFARLEEAVYRGP
jgi:hypothetical protein